MSNNIGGTVLFDAYYDLSEEYSLISYSISAEVLKNGNGDCKLQAVTRDTTGKGAMVSYVNVPENSSFQKLTLSNIIIPDDSIQINLRFAVNPHETETILYAKNLNMWI